jgi:hypothetical protein
MATTLQRCELWTDLQCAGGTRQAILPLDHCTRLETTTRIARDDDGILELSKDAAAYAYLAIGCVLRLLYTDGTFDEWRIAEVQDASRSSRTARVRLQSVLLDLNVKDTPFSVTNSKITTFDIDYTDKTPLELVTLIMAQAPSWFDVGTITPNRIIDLSVSKSYPLRALRGVVNALRAAGVACELDYRRNGTAGYYIDIVTSIGSTAQDVDVRTAKNLLATTRTARLGDQASSVYMIGGAGVQRSGTPATIALGVWDVASVSGSDVELRGIEGCDDPILYDDQFNNAYLEKTDGTYTQITDTVASTQKVTVASAATIAAGQWLRLVSNSSGDDLTRLANPAAVVPLTQSRIIELSGLTDRINYVVNPTFERWTAGVPDGWTETDTLGAGTISEETAVVWHGTRSMKVVVACPGGSTPLVSFQSTSVNMSAPVATLRDQTASVWLYLDKSLSTGTPNGNFQLFSTSGAGTTINYTAITSQTWTRIDNTRNGAASSSSVIFRWATGSSLAMGLTFYVGAVMHEAAPTGRSPYIAGSDPSELHAAGNLALSTYSVGSASYVVSFADLGAWDPAAFPYDIVTLGAMANVRDTDLDITASYRIVEITRDHRNPLASRFTVSTRTPDLITFLSGIADI